MSIRLFKLRLTFFSDDVGVDRRAPGMERLSNGWLSLSVSCFELSLFFWLIGSDSE